MQEQDGEEDLEQEEVDPVLEQEGDLGLELVEGRVPPLRIKLPADSIVISETVSLAEA
jgi:hypothetical protein